MPDKLKAKVFTILIFLKVTHINEALFWCFRFNTNLQFSIMSRNAKKVSRFHVSILETAMQSTMLEIIYRL